MARLILHLNPREMRQTWRVCSLVTLSIFIPPLQSICPGMVDTDFLSVYSQAVAELPKLQARDVAKAVLYALNTPDGVQVEDIILQQMRKVDWILVWISRELHFTQNDIICTFCICSSM